MKREKVGYFLWMEKSWRNLSIFKMIELVDNEGIIVWDYDNKLKT